MARPEGETRTDRRRQKIVGFGIVLIFALLGTNIGQGVILYRVQENLHVATTAQNNEILKAEADHAATLTEIKNLETEVAMVIKGLPAADTEIIKFAQWLEICVAQDHETDCPAPPIPTS